MLAKIWAGVGASDCSEAIPAAKNYRAAGEVVEELRKEAVSKMKKFLAAIALLFEGDGVKVKTVVTGSLPARTIVAVSKKEAADMIMMTSRGRGGMDLLLSGSVALKVVENSCRFLRSRSSLQNNRSNHANARTYSQLRRRRDARVGADERAPHRQPDSGVSAGK
ncbi:MAG: universal stress protein [Anaerolineales bacterium]|nr:universal stress protein [Anaerolineales bacterium]